jgi:hypothetical protein
MWTATEVKGTVFIYNIFENLLLTEGTFSVFQLVFKSKMHNIICVCVI